jgi:hypothetical protein
MLDPRDVAFDSSRSDFRGGSDQQSQGHEHEEHGIDLSENLTVVEKAI